MNAINRKGYQDIPMTRRRAQLLAEYANKLAEMLENAPDDQDLAEWVQSKIDRAADQIQSAYHYLDQEDDDDLEKAVGHKYTHRKRVGTDKRGRARYRYYYAEHQGGGISRASFEAGSAFKLTWKGRRGHFHIDRVEGDQVFITHDSRPSMTPVAISKGELRALLKSQHGKAEQEHVEKRRKEVEKIKSKGVKRGLGLALHRLRQAAQVAGVQLDERYQQPKKKKTTETAREDRFETMPEVESAPRSKTPAPKTRADLAKLIHQELLNAGFKGADLWIRNEDTDREKARIYLSGKGRKQGMIEALSPQEYGSEGAFRLQVIQEEGLEGASDEEIQAAIDRRSSTLTLKPTPPQLDPKQLQRYLEAISAVARKLKDSAPKILDPSDRPILALTLDYTKTPLAQRSREELETLRTKAQQVNSRESRPGDKNENTHAVSVAQHIMREVNIALGETTAQTTQTTPRNQLIETAQQIIEDADQDHDERHDEHQEITKFELGEHTHTKTGAKLFTAKQKERTDRDEYFRRLEIAKKHGGRYESRYVKGFVFRSAEDARNFALEVEGAAQTPKSAETVTPHEDHPSADNFETMPEVESAPTQRLRGVLDALSESERLNTINPKNRKRPKEAESADVKLIKLVNELAEDQDPNDRRFLKVMASMLQDVKRLYPRSAYERQENLKNRYATIREFIERKLGLEPTVTAPNLSETLSRPTTPSPRPTTPSPRPTSEYYGRATKKLVDQALSSEPTGFDIKSFGANLPTKGDLREMLSQEQRIKRAKEDLKTTGAPNFLGERKPLRDIMFALGRYLNGPYTELDHERIRYMERGLKIALRDSKGEELEQVKDETARFWREWGGEYKRLQSELVTERTQGEALRNIRRLIPERALTPEINQQLDQMELTLNQKPVSAEKVSEWIDTRDTNEATRDRQPPSPAREQLTETASTSTPKRLLDDIRSEITVERFMAEGRRREDTAEREVKKILKDLENLEQGLLNREYSTEAKQAKAQEILNRRLPKILEQMRRLVSAKLVIPQLSGGAGQRNAARYHRAAGDVGIAQDRANEEYRRALKELDRLEERQPQAAPREQLTETAPETRLNVKQVRAREAIKRARGAQTMIKTSNRADKLTSTGRRARASINEDKQLIEAVERIIDQDYREMERPLPSDINQRTSQQDNFAKLRGALNNLKSSQTLTRGSWTDDQESLKKKRIKARSEIEDALKDLEARSLEELQTQIQVNIEDLPPKGQRTAEDAKRFFGEPRKNTALKTVTYERDGHIITGPASGRGEGKFRYDLSLPRERFRDEPLLSGSLSSNEIGTYDTLDEALTAAINQYEPSDQIIDRMIDRAKEDRERTAQRMVATPREQLTETAREQLAETVRNITAPSSPLNIDQANAQDTLTEDRTRSAESKAADKALIESARELAKTSERGEEIKSALVDLMNAQQLKRYKRATGEMSARAEDMIEKRRQARERLRAATSGEVIDARLDRDLARDARETAKQEAREAQEARQYQKQTFTPEIQSAIESLKSRHFATKGKSYPLETYLKTRKDGGIYKTTETPAELADRIAENLPDTLANLYDFGEDTLRALITKAINEGVEARETPAELKDRIGAVITKRFRDNAASQKAQITGEGQREALIEMKRNIKKLLGDGFFNENRRRGERSYMGLGAIEKTLDMSERLSDLYVDGIFAQALPPELERFKLPVTRFGRKAADEVAGAFANKYETVGEIRDNISTIKEQMRATIKRALDQTTDALVKRPTTLDLINQSYEKATERLNTDRQKNIENARALAQYTDNPQAHLAEIQELERQSDQAIAEQMEINREFASAYIHEASDLAERALETTKGEVIDNVMKVKTPLHANKFTATERGTANRKLMARIFNQVFEQVRREIGDEPIERGEKHPRNIADTVKKPSKTPAQFREDIDRAERDARERLAERWGRITRKSANHMINYRAQLLQTIERIA